MLEYGTDCLEMHVDAVHPGERVLVIDDLVATGGTLSAAIRLLGKISHYVACHSHQIINHMLIFNWLLALLTGN